MRKSFSEYVDKRNLVDISASTQALQHSEGVTDIIRRFSGNTQPQLSQSHILEVGSIRDSLMELIKTAANMQTPYSEQLVKLLQQAEQYCRKPFQNKNTLF